jgi:hypothetical protein
MRNVLTYGCFILCFFILVDGRNVNLHAQTISFTQDTLVNSFNSFGCSVADYDNDGWDDIMVAGWNQCALYHNNHDSTFTDVATQAGVNVTGRNCVAILGDINNDGFPDLFIGARDMVGTNHLFINNGNGTFTDISSNAGIDTLVSVGTASFGDFNSDGKLDLFLATTGNAPDKLYKNISTPGTVLFHDVSDSAAIGGNPSSPAMQATWMDYNHDGYPDLFCVHDGLSYKNRLYQNTGTFPFQDVAVSAHLDSIGVGNSMGTSWCDYNNDGWEDVYVTRIGKGGFYKNNGDGTFTNISQSSGADSNGMSWGVVFADFDNDGDEDIFIAGTQSFDGRKSFLYENVNGVFHNIAPAANAALAIDAYGVATGDFNNDGYEDIFVTKFSGGGQNRLLLNAKTATGHWVKFSLRGVTANRMAIGTKIRVVAGGVQRVRTISGGASYCSQVSPVLHVGLGTSTLIDTLEIFWKKDVVQRFTQLSVDTTYKITEGLPLTSVDERHQSPIPSQAELFQNYPNPFNPTTNFGFRISNFGFVSLKVYDLLGREVATLVNEGKQPGTYTATWDASSMPSGIYVARMVVIDRSTNFFSQSTKKIVLTK